MSGLKCTGNGSDPLISLSLLKERMANTKSIYKSIDYGCVQPKVNEDLPPGGLCTFTDVF